MYILYVILSVAITVLGFYALLLFRERLYIKEWNEKERPTKLFYVHGLRPVYSSRRTYLIDVIFSTWYWFFYPETQFYSWCYNHENTTFIKDASFLFSQYVAKHCNKTDRVAILGHSFGGVIVYNAIDYLGKLPFPMRVVTVASPLKGAYLMKMIFSYFGDKIPFSIWGPIAIELLPENRKIIPHDAWKRIIHTNIVFDNPIIRTDGRVFHDDQKIYEDDIVVKGSEHVFSFLDMRVITYICKGMKFPLKIQ